MVLDHYSYTRKNDQMKSFIFRLQTDFAGNTYYFLSYHYYIRFSF